MALLLLQLFFPYLYYSSSNRKPNSEFQVGIHYVYEQDTVSTIYTEVQHIHDLGFKLIRITLEYDRLNPESSRRTDAFYAATQQFNMNVALATQNHQDLEIIRYYLNRWGKYASYIQILNEPESSTSWDVGALFTDDEIMTRFQETYTLVEPHRTHAQLYTNFGAGFMIRANLPIQMSEKLDFIGLDVYMESFLILSPDFVELLHKITKKDIIITEYGMSTTNDTAQSDFIIRGLTLFKSMGLKACWLAYWNSEFDNYGIRGRLAEKTIGEWIAQNAKNN